MSLESPEEIDLQPDLDAEVPSPHENETGPTSPSLEALQKHLDNLNQDHHLIIHQTASDTATRIMEGQYFSGGSGLTGTALIQEPASILDTIPFLGSHTFGRTHKGADAILIMALPRATLKEYIDQNSPGSKENLDTVDEMLIDLYQAGKISEIGLPNKFIYGYFSEGKLCINPNFSPKF